jgi:hypothetical protein
MRFNPHAFKRLTEPPPVGATDPGSAPSVAASTPADLNPTLAAFIAAYGRPGANQVSIPEGSMAVTLSLKFNDSAAQVDHFNYHAGLGCPAFIVLLVKKQAQTENLARKALTACPELHSLDWQWKSEKYGGGHGNYLISSAIDLPVAVTQSLTAKHTFSGQPVTRAFWEIQFANAWRGSPLQLWPHKHYGAPVVQSAFSNGRDAGNHSPITAAWCLNEQRRGVEIHFTRRPDDAALAPLRADRAWNYTGRTKCWYAKQTPATIAWAKAFCEKFNGGIVTPPAPLVAGLPSLPEREPAQDARASAAPAVPPSSPSRPIPTPQVPPMPGMTPLGLKPARPERKFIRYQPEPDDPEVALQHADDAEAEREVLQAEYLNSQGRAEFYEANSPDRTLESGWRSRPHHFNPV